jgi:heat shock protein HslJ
MYALFLTLPIILAGTMPTTTAAPSTGFPAAETTWTLTELDGAAFEGRATVSFAEPGRIAGQAPCNSYTGPIEGTPQAFTIGAIAATRMACPDLELETKFLDTLASMTSVEETDRGIILRNGAGAQLVFIPVSG